MSKKFYVNIDLQGNKTTGAADPTAATDYSTKQYVDNKIDGLAYKDEVRGASTTAGVLILDFENGDSLDGLTLATGDRILIKDQAVQTENGIYTVNASGAPTRATDANSTTDLNNATVYVTDGTTNSGREYTQTTKNPTVGVSNIVFAQKTTGTTYSADGNGIELSGSTFALELDGTTLTKGSSGLRIGSGAAGNGITEASGVLAVNTGTGVEISSDAVRLATQGTGIAGGGGSTLSRDHSLVADWKSALGPGSAGTTITYAHGLGQTPKAVLVTIESSGEDITHGVDITVDATNVVVTFGSSQSDRSLYRVSAVG